MPSVSKGTTESSKTDKKVAKPRATKKAVDSAKPAATKKRASTKAVASTKDSVQKPVKEAAKKTAAAAKKAPRAKASKVAAGSVITSEERHRMIAEAAYYLAEKRGFAPGHDEADWQQASQEIDSVIING